MSRWVWKVSREGGGSTTFLSSLFQSSTPSMWQRSSSSHWDGTSCPLVCGHCSSFCHGESLKESVTFLLTPSSFEIFIYMHWWDPFSVFSSLYRPRSFSLSSYERCSRPQTIFMATTGPSPAVLCLSCTEEPRAGHSSPVVASLWLNKEGGSPHSTYSTHSFYCRQTGELLLLLEQRLNQGLVQTEQRCRELTENFR